MDLLLEHIGKGFIVMLLISMPCVLTAAGIGLVIGILQAVTQVQEQTIAAAPKILAVFLVIMIFGGFFTDILIQYIRESANLAFNVVTKEDYFVLPPEGYLTKPAMDEENYSGMKSPDKVNQIMKNPGKIPYAERKEKFSTTKAANFSKVNPNLVERKLIESR
jgi:flagellar biosynthetic protein FliQ